MAKITITQTETDGETTAHQIRQTIGKVLRSSFSNTPIKVNHAGPFKSTTKFRLPKISTGK